MFFLGVGRGCRSTCCKEKVAREIEIVCSWFKTFITLPRKATFFFSREDQVIARSHPMQQVIEACVTQVISRLSRSDLVPRVLGLLGQRVSAFRMSLRCVREHVRATCTPASACRKYNNYTFFSNSTYPTLHVLQHLGVQRVSSAYALCVRVQNVSPHITS